MVEILIKFNQDITLAIADILLLGLSVAFVILAVSVLRKKGERHDGSARSQVA